ncbi:DNA-binding SARP family transcriptional activator [Actinokineospora auranticolor]|uniref:DNA-binding SARP family transcriptional activator n=1 Tax=Actinokineospora auranticolor TaxID=155976 RepID=A0A2S6GDA3_9PSEU|nr:DNA-binding SARP family transcriptional activator [Actinokineospora auranticolor]
MPPGELQVLGPFRARRGDVDVPLPVGVLRTVLAALALAGRPVPRPRLLDLAWPEAAPHSGHKAVHVAVSRLRAWLRAEFPDTRIHREHDSYHLVTGPTTSTDAARFEHLVADGLDPAAHPALRVDGLLAALALWRGPVLDGHPVAAAFPTAVRWDLSRISAACALADAATAVGRPAAAVPTLATLAAERPTDEAVYASWARLLVACGRQAEALAALNTLRARLVDDLGIEPGPVLRTTFQQVLNTYPAQPRDDTAVLRVLSDPRGGPPSGTYVALFGARQARLGTPSV